MAELRVVDDGVTDPWRSQALWHGIASAMRPDAAPVLSFCRPARPYVSIGLHRSRDEVDELVCTRRGWPVIRRRIGGGPVYLDRDQLFFQITLPAARAPARVQGLYDVLLAPAVAAFRALGVAAEMRGVNDIAVADRRLSGTGAGRIGEAVTVVGNVIFDLPHGRMVEALALPDEEMRAECRRLMERHVTSLAREGCGDRTARDARSALVDAFARALSLSPRPDALATGERSEVQRWVERLRSADRAVTGRPHPAAGRQVKICAGVWVYRAVADGLGVLVSVVDGRLDRVRVDGAALNGEARRLSAALLGARSRPQRVERRLRPFGALGRRLGSLLEPGLVLGGG